MSRLSLWFLLALALIGAGCGYSSKNMGAGGGGVGSPNITELMPNNANMGGMAFTLTVNGSGFGTDAVVYWNGAPQTSMYLSGNQVTAQISATDLMNPGMVAVYVRTGGMNSNSVNFQVM
jgi:hypothetical protein